MTSASCFVALLCFISAAVAASSSVSGGSGSHGFSGRVLLQKKKRCPIDFQRLSYTSITSRCRGPLYPARSCCQAPEDFACPYADQLNDPSNNCASSMYSYIYRYGKYPPGLFDRECNNGRQGFHCAAASPEYSVTSGRECGNGIQGFSCPATFPDQYFITSKM